MKNIDDLLHENPYLFAAVMVLIESAKKHDFNAMYKWDCLRDEDYKRKSMKYFIDYSEDTVLPSAGKASLVEEYAILMDIKIFETREEMLEAVADIASYARHGVNEEQIFTDEELTNKIGKFSIDLPII